MTYAVMPALQDNVALYRDWAPQLTSRAYDPALTLWKHKPGVTMGMPDKQCGSDLHRASDTHMVRRTPVCPQPVEGVAPVQARL